MKNKKRAKIQKAIEALPKEVFGKEDIINRRCNYCRKNTPTKDEDCIICGFSKPYDHEKER